MKSNYNLQPYVVAENCGNESCFSGYNAIAEELNKKLQEKEKVILVIDCYPGVLISELEERLISKIPANLVMSTDDDIFHDNTYVNEKIKDFMTDDRVFGIMTLLKFDSFIDNILLEGEPLSAFCVILKFWLNYCYKVSFSTFQDRGT